MKSRDHLISAHMLISCPYATLMANSKASVQWSIDDIVQSMKCQTCFMDAINHWAPCIRLSSQVNLHPSLTSRCRQMWFMIMQFIKFLPEDDYSFESDAKFTFLGHNNVNTHRYMINSADRRRILHNMPKFLQNRTIVSRGMYTYIKTRISFHFLLVH